MKKILFAVIAVAFILGFGVAWLRRSSPPSVTEELRKCGKVVHEEPLQEPAVPVVLPPQNSERSSPPDLRGMSIGNGEVLADVPSSSLDFEKLGEALSSPQKEEEGIAWPKTTGKLKKIEDQVREIREDIDETTLDAVSRALNALPFVSAEPEEAEWHISGGEIGLEVTIPADNIRIGSRKDPSD